MSESLVTRPGRSRRLGILGAGLVLGGLVPAAFPGAALAAVPVFINEIHYDNTGTDAGEAIEVAGPAGTDLSGWSIVLYNGAGGAAYDTDVLAGVIPDLGAGFGTLAFSYPVNGIQNGSPDGIALVDATSTVTQFLSYEGTFAAVGGPANGMSSVDIGVSEAGTEPLGQSLQLTGTGVNDDDFTWSAPATATFGAVNGGQTFGSPVDAAPFVATTTPADGATGVAVGADIGLSFSEPVDVSGDWFDIACTVSAVHEAIVSGGPTDWTLDPDADFAAGETCTVTILGPQVTDVDGNDPPDAMAEDRAFSFDVATPGVLADVWINEIHYDNAATDAGESIEVAGPAGTDLSGWSIVLYNGTGGAAYDTDLLTGVIPDQQAGFGAVALTYPVNGIQNGSPDGIALVGPGGEVVQFLSYEGSFTAVGGPANGMSSVDIGVAEAGTEAVGLSLQLTGIGLTYADFAWQAPAPATFGAVNGGQFFSTGDPAPAVAATNPTGGALGVHPGASVSITFSEPVDVTGSWFSIACTSSGAHPATSMGGPTVFTLDPGTDFQNGESCTVTILAANVADQDPSDPPDTMAADYLFSFTVAVGCGDPATFIHDVQGSGPASPIVGMANVAVEGVVVGDYQQAGGMGGFHVQEEDAQADADAATSEGIFIFNTAVAVSPGDVVRVNGTVTEFGTAPATLTELAGVSSVQVCATGASVTPAALSLPFASGTFAERFEGMLVDVAQTLTVTETFSLGRFGEVVLSSGGRLSNPTSIVEPGAPAQAQQAANDLNRIVLDDGDNQQNIDPTLYPQGGLSAANTLRVGDALAGGTFVAEQQFGTYRFQPVGAVAFDHTNPRPVAPDPVGGNLKVAAMNVLNYFTTLDAPGAGPFTCGPLANLECRGANSAFEFQRQRDKIIAALVGLDADVVGLMEIENNASASLADLVAGLNAATAPGTWAFIDTGTIGTDAIKVGIIYRPGRTTPVGAHAILDSSVDPTFIDTLNRPSLAQTFDRVGGGRLTVVVNHLKSKGSDCNAVGDPDTGDGQGNCNLTRTAAAHALVNWIATDPTGSGDRDVLVIGDMNSYAREDPIDVFVAAGYANLIDQQVGDEAYSFVFQGQSGYLDHALASPTLAAQVNDAAEWHISADEPTVLDYNTEFKSANHVTTLYAPGPYRSSDHDPLLVGLNLLDYRFSGFRPPVSNPPMLNKYFAGLPVPIRFLLADGLGSSIFFNPPTTTPIDCATRLATGPSEKAHLVGGPELKVNRMRSYTYLWFTKGAWRGTCRSFELILEDGTYRSAQFRF